MLLLAIALENVHFVQCVVLPLRCHRQTECRAFTCNAAGFVSTSECRTSWAWAAGTGTNGVLDMQFHGNVRLHCSCLCLSRQAFSISSRETWRSTHESDVLYFCSFVIRMRDLVIQPMISDENGRKNPLSIFLAEAGPESEKKRN
jgi:hypothetical protein